MLSSINPLGERARDQRWWLTATAYAGASAAGGLVVGTMMALVGSIATGSISFPARTASAAVVLAAAAALEWRGGALPGPRRQVNEDWLSTYRGWVYGAGFGGQLGLEVATTVTTSALYAALVIAAVLASPMAGAWIGLAFGLGRAVPVLLMWRIDRPEPLRGLHRRMLASAPRVRSATAGLLTGCAVVCFGMTAVGA